MTTTTSSPRGVADSIEVLHSSTNDHLQKLAQEGYRAVQELERVLFFTDLKDDTTRQQAAKQGLHAIEDLQQLLFVSSIDLEDMQQHKYLCGAGGDRKLPAVTCGNTFDTIKEESGCAHLSCFRGENMTCTHKQAQPEYSPDIMARGSSSITDLVLKNTATVNMMDLLTTHFQAALESGQRTLTEMGLASHKALKEAERRILFTDLDETKLAKTSSTDDDESPSVHVWQEVETLLQEMENKFAVFAVEKGQPALEAGQRAWKGVEQSSQRAYKECERTLLFTDLDESALAKDKTKDDMISHFINTQSVFQELQRKFFKSSITGGASKDGPVEAS